MTEFISRKYGNEGYEIIIKTDSYDHYTATEDFARRLIDHSKPQTNELLIDANSLIEDLEFLAKHEDSFRQSVILGVVHMVKARKTIDAVEVVRCKDCKYFKTLLCQNEDNHENWFCADGERK